MDITKLSAIEIREKIKMGELTTVEVVKSLIKKVEETKKYNAVLEIFDDALKNAEEMDKKIKSGFSGKLAGVPVLIKDIIMYKGKICSCSSKFMEHYVASYDATVVKRMLDEGAVIIGRTNMDEFAMGGSTENSAFGVTHNPWDFSRVAGGSSGGSAAAVALGLCPIALGTDTGGSVRQPASYCGIYGLKPSYGIVPRFGVVAFASSFEQVGIFSRTIEDNALMFEVLSGVDENDETSVDVKKEDYLKELKTMQKFKVGVPKEVLKMAKGLPSEKTYLDFINLLKKNGVEIVDISIKDIELSLATYYILTTAEAASNLSRFDGVKYTPRNLADRNLQEIYKNSRSSGFGKEVKRRIMLGNYVLSSGYYDAYYKKAQAVRGVLKKEFEDAFSKCDLIIMPTTVGEAFKIGSKSGDPVDVYKEDIFTVTANSVQMPSMSVPFGKGENGLPIGIQIMANRFNEKNIFKLAKFIENKKGE